MVPGQEKRYGWAMITNLLFTALCLGIAFLVTLDVRAPRRQPVRVARQARDGRHIAAGRN